MRRVAGLAVVARWSRSNPTWLRPAIPITCWSRPVIMTSTVLRSDDTGVAPNSDTFA